MGRVNSSISDLSRQLYANGYNFLLPGFCLYWVWWFFTLNVSHLTTLLVGMNFFLAVCFCYYLRELYRQTPSIDRVYWIGLFFLFLLPGAYLEFPSDPWDHMWRIFRWGNLQYVSEHIDFLKYGFFWTWSLISWVPVAHHRLALDIYSAALQLLVIYQLYLFCLCLGMERSWAKVQGLAFIALFGTTVFSYRYYALSSTPLAYIAYFRALIVIFNFTKGCRKEILLLPLLVLFILGNHLQELLFLLLSAPVLLFAIYFKNQSRPTQVRYIKGLGVILLCSLAIGKVFIQFYPELYAKMGLIHFSSFGTFKIRPGKWRINETLGIHGFISLAFSVILFFRYPILASLTLAPFLCLLNPPAMLVLTHVLPEVGVVWRLLFAMPTALMFVVGLREITKLICRLGRIHCSERYQLFAVLTLVLLFGIPPQYPWNGRLFFQFYRAPDSLSLKHVDPLATWIDQHIKLPDDCLFLSDLPTTFALQAHLGKMHIDRRQKTVMYSQYLVDQYLDPSCGVVVNRLANYPKAPPSLIGRLSKHWKENGAHLDQFVTPDFEQAAEALVAKGWKKHSLSPLCTYYERP